MVALDADDASNEIAANNGVEIDRLTMMRASSAAVTPTLPEVAQPWMLPVAGVAAAGQVAAARWRRTDTGLDVPADH